MFPCKMFNVKMFQFKNVRFQHLVTRSRQFRRSASHSPSNSSRTTSRIRSRVGPDLDLPYKLSCQKISVRHCAVLSLSKYLGNLFLLLAISKFLRIQSECNTPTSYRSSARSYSNKVGIRNPTIQNETS